MGKVIELFPNGRSKELLPIPVPPVNQDVAEALKRIVNRALSGELQAFVLIGEFGDGASYQVGNLAGFRDLHLLNSLLTIEQQRVTDFIMQQQGYAGPEEYPLPEEPA